MKMPYSRTGSKETEGEEARGRAASALAILVHSKQLASEKRLLRDVMSKRGPDRQASYKFKDYTAVQPAGKYSLEPG